MLLRLNSLWDSGKMGVLVAALELQEDLVRWGHYETGRLEGNGTSIEALGVREEKTGVRTGYLSI